MSQKNSNDSEQEIVRRDFNDFTNQLDLIDNNKNTDILDQLPSYNCNDTVCFIRNIQTELDQQKTLNSLLESSSSDIKQHIENVKQFVKENNNRVSNQLEEIKTISNELKNLVEKNTKLREKHVELNQITAQPEYMSMAKNMQEIKRQKEDIRNFLEKMGIVSPPLNF